MVQEAGNLNVVPTDVINSALPWWQFGPDIARMLAQTSFGNLSNIQQAQIAAGASTQNAQTQAGATIGAAGIGAQSRVDAQLIATNGAIAQANAQMRTDATLAAAGDINAYRRLIQTQQYTSQLENNKNRMEIAKLAGSGSLFDNIAARYAASGKGALPQMGGAFGLGGGIQNVTTPTGNAPLSIEQVLSHLQPAAMQSGGGGGFDFSSLAGLFGGGGGGGYNAQMPNIGDIFSQLNEQIYGSLSQFPGELFTTDPATSSYAPPQTASDFTFGVTGDPAQSASNTDAAWAALLANPDAYMHSGGRLKPGESGIVGDDRGRLTPFSELVRNVNGEVEITPLGGRGLGNFRGKFHTGTGPHGHDSKPIPEGVLGGSGSIPSPWDINPPTFPQPGDPDYVIPQGGEGFPYFNDPVAGAIPRIDPRKSAAPPPVRTTPGFLAGTPGWQPGDPNPTFYSGPPPSQEEYQRYEEWLRTIQMGATIGPFQASPEFQAWLDAERAAQTGGPPGIPAHSGDPMEVKAGGPPGVGSAYPEVQYESPFGRQRLTAASPSQAYTPTPAETAQIETQARAELDAQIAAAPWYQRTRMQGNYQGTLLGIINRLTQELVANPPPPSGADIGIPPGEEPVVEPPPTTPPPVVPPPTTPPPTDGVLSDVSNIPALEALRSGSSGQSIFDFGENYFSRPEQGIATLPSPFNFGKPFLTMPNSQRQDVLDFYKSQFALKPEDTMAMFFASQPGYRRSPSRAFGF